MASENDMRRHNSPQDAAMSKPPAEPVDAGVDGVVVSSGRNGAVADDALPSHEASGHSSAVEDDENDDVVASDRPETPPIQEETAKHRRFSMLRFRNASDPQLSARAKKQAEAPPPLPRPPEIITTAPTIDLDQPPRKPPLRMRIGLRRSTDVPRSGLDSVTRGSSKKDKRKTMAYEEPAAPILSAVANRSDLSLSPRSRPPSRDGGEAPSTNHHSEPLKPDGAPGAIGVEAPPPVPIPASTPFFRLRRRKQKEKQPDSMFPLSHLPQQGQGGDGANSSISQSSLVLSGVPHEHGVPTAPVPYQHHLLQTLRPSRPHSAQGSSTSPFPSPSHNLLGRPNASPATVVLRPSSRNSGQSSPARGHQVPLRGRSSTLSSVGRESVDDHLVPPTTRTSTSTGRKSFGDLFSLGRLRQNSEGLHGRHGTLTPATPASNTSKNNSLQLPRESVVLPGRREDDTPAKYLARLEEVVSRSVIASALSKGTDSFSEAVLRSYMRTFSFFGDPMDMAIRKLLMETELPKETQQIDRCLQSFANRYHECNPGIYATPDQAYFIAFSLLILHTDVFNKNNKHKMQKVDYLKNTHGEGVSDDILECFYDNITYTPFIRVEDDELNGDRFHSIRSRQKFPFPNGAPDSIRKASKEPIDPYNLIMEGKLDILRPNLKEVMQLEDHYSYLGTAKNLNLTELQKTFFRTGILQIVSARSRPDAFMSDKTATNPEEAHPGIVDIKVTKVGLLWRKDAKKKKTRSPWQEWGAILTGAQLYFFRNTAWVKSLIHQYDTHIRQGHDGIPIIFTPPLDQFKPDALMSTADAVALVDASYKRHKNAFLYVRHGGFEEVLLADNEDEMNDWLAKLNYAAAFRTSGVRMRGVGGNDEGQIRRGIRRLDSSDATTSIQTPTGEVTIARGRIDFKEARDIFMARREVMRRKIEDAGERLRETQVELDVQLRNARHIQILAPIQAKTREQMLFGAGRMSALLKWSLIEIWKLKCHRDILMMDLEEEKQSGAWARWDEATGNLSPTDRIVASPVENKPSSGGSGGGPHSPTPSRQRSGPVQEPDSPLADVFQTPPMSAASPAFLEQQASWELPPLTFDSANFRKTSVSSAASSVPPVPSTPPRHIATSSSCGRESASIRGLSDDVDAGERGLLEKAGLISPKAVASHEGSAAGTDPSGTPERREHVSAGAADKQDRTKIRRSLQRTLREGAGHLSHARSRKGKDSASTAGTNPEEAPRESDKLSRGTGSFVVHGKKASVINFGSELQSFSPDERIRQRKQSHRGGHGGGGSADGQHHQRRRPTPSGSGALAVPDDDYDDDEVAVGEASAGLYSGPVVAVFGGGHRDRRESAASASTATARSFRDLRRKYSSAQAAVKAPAAAVPSASSSAMPQPFDDDDDEAVDSDAMSTSSTSSSASADDGRGTPQPSRIDEDGREAVDASGDEPDELLEETQVDDTTASLASKDTNGGQGLKENAVTTNGLFVSSAAVTSNGDERLPESAGENPNDSSPVVDHEGERLPSPQVQAVSA